VGLREGLIWVDSRPALSELAWHYCG